MEFVARIPRPSHVRRIASSRLRFASLLQNPSQLALQYRSSSTKPLVPTLPPEPPLGFKDTNDVQVRPAPLAKTAPGCIPHKWQTLPVSCPGCGALTQDIEPGTAGFYTRTRKAVRKYLKGLRKEDHGGRSEEPHALGDPSTASIGVSDEISSQQASLSPGPPSAQSLPICDRCHDLIHESKGSPIAHPSMEDVADSIAESPYSRNHVYHVIDAADFPMSVIPSIYKDLSVAKPRTQNRRSPRFQHGTKPGLSFIITRSDLLGPTKEIVDKMMPKLTAILRSALGRSGEKLRLGNVHLVSSKRGWWTPGLKDSIWERGGGNWLVGKFNVGKSSLFEVIFPKGSGDRAPSYAELEQEQHEASQSADYDGLLAEDSLLPPAQPEVPFPSMPLVSSLPGTTASPIRLPFGNHRGELIDLPGLERSSLQDFVSQAHKLDLVMSSRPVVNQFKIKPGQSLLLGGGLVRITPILDENDPSTILMAYPFIPLEAHVTSTAKATESQLQQRESGIDSILTEDAGSSMALAGSFALETNVTRARAGSVIRAGVDPSKLPFEVFATDLLIEGVGWIELVCQVRKSRRKTSLNLEANSAPESAQSAAVPQSEQLSLAVPNFLPYGGTDLHAPRTTSEESIVSYFPRVEVFTPSGRSISQRPCLGIWQQWNGGLQRTYKRGARPRKSMSGAKKQERSQRLAATQP